MVHVMFLWCCLSYAFHFAKLSSHRQRLEQREKAVSEPQKGGCVMGVDGLPEVLGLIL